MLGVNRFIVRFSSPLEAERALMDHYAAKQKALFAWDRRYAHMQFVTQWAPRFRRHIAPSLDPKSASRPFAA